MPRREKGIIFALRVTAAVNTGAGVASAADPSLSVKLLFGESVLPLSPVMHANYSLLWLTVAVIGIGYWLASRNPSEQTAMIWVGGIGKWATVVIWSTLLMNGLAKPLVALPIAFDAVWGTWLLSYVVARRRERARQTKTGDA